MTLCVRAPYKPKIANCLFPVQVRQNYRADKFLLFQGFLLYIAFSFGFSRVLM